MRAVFSAGEQGDEAAEKYKGVEAGRVAPGPARAEPT